MIDPLDMLGAVAATYGVTMAIAPLLQARRILVTRNSRDVSLAYLFVMQVGFVIWLAYGLALGNPYLFIPNAVALTVGAITIALALRYREGKDPSRILHEMAVDAYDASRR